MRITVIGTGYVGLVVGTCLAEMGHFVQCADVDEKKIAILKGGKLPIFEPGLEEMVSRNMEGEEPRLIFTTDVEGAIDSGTVIFLCVGTPPQENGCVDMQYVYAAARTIGEVSKGYKIVVNKSTVPVGTSDKVREIISEHCDAPFDVVSNPEFLKEGAAVDDFMKPDRVVIGANDVRVMTIMRELYEPFIRTGARIYEMDNRSAELVKYASNAFLATRISFMNEVANLAEVVGANVNQVRRGVGSDTRIGFQFLFPGAGYGGSCFPKDVDALVHTADDFGFEMKILKAVNDVNNRQKRRLGDKILKRFGNIEGRTFAVWGLAFKPRTDDMREAPALALIETLLENGAKVRASDPVANDVAREIFGDRVEILDEAYHCLEGASALAVVTEWHQFRQPNFERIKKDLKNPLIFDGRNIYDPERLDTISMEYHGIGVKGEYTIPELV